jgi:hypothetical protein
MKVECVQAKYPSLKFGSGERRREVWGEIFHLVPMEISEGEGASQRRLIWTRNMKSTNLGEMVHGDERVCNCRETRLNFKGALLVSSLQLASNIKRCLGP